MNFITKLEFTADLEKMKQDLENVITTVNWPEKKFEENGQLYHANQIGITHRANAAQPWFDASGSLKDQKTGEVIAKEGDFSVLNDAVGDYTKSILAQLSLHVNCRFGRIRYMRLMPKTGLSIHADSEQRYHYVLDTHKGALFGHYTDEDPVIAKCYHLPADGHFYKVDTRLPHFVYNGGWQPRIHLVICEA